MSLLLLAACGTAPAPEPDRPSAVIASEARRIVLDLEEKFYGHWGAVERTEPYAKLTLRHREFLREIADQNGHASIMALRLIETRWPGEEHYSAEARAMLYAAALRREHNFTRWGVISGAGFIPAVYGAELLALGKIAAPHLRPLLADRRRAPVPGGEANRLQGDRVCDYAWVLLATILDRPLTYHADPDRRNPQIRELETALGGKR